jgi:shikimate kinase
VLRPDNCRNLERAGFVVCLDVPINAIVERLATMQDRPLLAQADRVSRITELMVARAPAYAAIMQHIDCADRSPLEVAESILVLYDQTAAPWSQRKQTAGSST